MKTSAELQAQSVRRKLIYFATIIVLFTLVTFSGSLARTLTGRIPSWTISRRADALQLTESTQGHADVAGSSVRLLLTGSRGIVVCVLWVTTQEHQKRHEWNEVEVLVQSITKLQPHFLTPWLFQSWNLAYNVSVESDRVRDKYFYISKGIQLLAEGERINRGRGYDDEGEFETGNPDMRYWIGFYYMNKFGVSDEATTLRSLFQMSCINPAKRTNLRGEGGKISTERMREFVKENPMLVRRLRERLRCSTLEEVVLFLEDNQKIPTRYEAADAGWRLKSNTTDQFPVVPDKVWDASKSGISIDPGVLHGEFPDNFINYSAALWWMCFAQDPLPPYEYGKPARATPPQKPLRHRLPRSPMLILFRQAPPRNVSFIADTLQKDGWFDESGWVIEDQAWFTGPDGRPEQLVVGAEPRYSSRQAWQTAYDQWNRHGDEHGMKLDQAAKDRLDNLAQLYRRTYQIAPGGMGPELNRAQVDDAMWTSYDAHQQLTFLAQNLQATNYKHFLYESQAESDPRIVEVRKLFYDADRQRKQGNPELAMRRYEAAFDRLRGSRAENRRGLLEEYLDFRNDKMTQDTLVEHQIEYVRLLYEHRGAQLRASIASSELLRYAAAQTSNPFNLGGLVAASMFQYFPNVRQLPLFVGPLDGADSAGNPWLLERNVHDVKQRLGLIETPNVPPAIPPDQFPTPPPM